MTVFGLQRDFKYYMAPGFLGMGFSRSRSKR